MNIAVTSQKPGMFRIVWNCLVCLGLFVVYEYTYLNINPSSSNLTKWSNTLKQKPTNCLSVFDHFVRVGA